MGSEVGQGHVTVPAIIGRDWVGLTAPPSYGGYAEKYNLGLTHLFTYNIFISTLLLPTYSGGQGGLRWAIKRTTDLIHFFISHRTGIGWR